MQKGTLWASSGAWASSYNYVRVKDWTFTLPNKAPRMPPIDRGLIRLMRV